LAKEVKAEREGTMAIIRGQAVANRLRNEEKRKLEDDLYAAKTALKRYKEDRSSGWLY